MTTAQNQALNQIQEIMREHFQAGIITVIGEIEGEDKKEDIQSSWHGGSATAYGLLTLASKHLDFAHRRAGR